MLKILTNTENIHAQVKLFKLFYDNKLKKLHKQLFYLKVFYLKFLLFVI